MSDKKKHLRPSNLLLGIILMIIHAATLSAVYIIGKKLGKSISGDQIAFLYKAGVLICTLPLLTKGGILNNLKTHRIKLHIVRAFFSLAATICFYRGLIKVPVLDATAITFLEPIIALISGIIYFKESFKISKVVSVGLCFIGTIFIIQPGFKIFNSSYFYLFGALIFWALNNLTMKLLGKTERTVTTIFYVSFLSTIMAFPLAISKSWAGFSTDYVKFVLLMTLFHLLHTICFFRALKLAELSQVMPFDYTRLFFTGLLGYVFLGETPTKLSAIGYFFIALGGILLIYFETKKRGWSRASEEKFLESQGKLPGEGS
jgi:drug/metabolite transporter (DMT)-like permease